MISSDKTVLESHAAERELIACCLCAPGSFTSIIAMVSGADFEDRELGRVYSAIVDLYECQAEQVLSERALLSGLRSAGVLGSLGDNHAIAELIHDGRLSRPSAMYYARQVAEASVNRRARSAVSRLMTQLNQGESWANVSRDAIADLAAIESGIVVESPVNGSELKQKAMDSLRSGVTAMCPSGFFRFDQAFGGFARGGVSVIAARTSVGKSLVSGDIAARVAEMGKRTLLVSLEMSEVELGYRFLSRAAEVDLNTFRKDEIRRHLDRLDASELSDGLHVWVKPRVKIEQVEAMVRKMKSEGGIDLVVIDYLGLMGGKQDKIYDRVTANSQAAKEMAIRNDVAVVLCSQLNRAAEDNSAPNLANLALSGSIEQDADLIVFLTRDKTKRPDVIRWTVMKNRNGSLGYMEFGFEGQYSRLDENDPNELMEYPTAARTHDDFSAWNG